MTAPPADPSTAARTPRPQGVLIASTLCWLWGVIMFFVAVAVLVPAIAASGLTGGALIAPTGLLLLAVAYLYGGYAVRRQRRSGGWAAVGAAGCMIALELRSGIVSAAGVGLVVNLAILGLVLANWRHLRTGSAPVVDA